MIGTSKTVSVTGVEPVSVDEAKAQLKISWDTEDDLLADYISEARAYCENVLFRALIAQTRIAYFDSFNYSGDCALTLFGPAASVESITYRDTEGTDQTLAAEDYILGSDTVATLIPSDSWPSVKAGPECVRVAYTCSPGFISPDIKASVKLRLSRLYAQREDPTDAKRTLSDNLLATSRNRVM
jgi:uncharacterized phiE125 gp8 family phage protein